MNMKLLAGAALATVFAASGAGAQILGWYGAIDVGGSHQPAMNAQLAVPAAGGFADASALNFRTRQIDYTGLARLGYRISPYLRVEIEGGYRNGGLRSVTDAPGSAVDLDLCNPSSPAGSCNSPAGSIDAWTGMGNIIFDMLPNSRIDPFIGAGVGTLHVKVRGYGNLESTTTNTSVAASVDDSQTVLGYQAIGGLSFQASERLNIDLTYRYLSGSKVHFQAVDQTDQLSTDLSGRYQDHSLTLGVRYAFGSAPQPAPPRPPPPPPPAPEAAPPPPPPPPPPPAPPAPVAYDARDYVIYFPWDQYVVTPEAQAVLQDVAKYATDGHATKETIIGFTDASGSVAYNERLSERRAKATADGLVSLGIPLTSLDVSWKGKSELAVPTADGVREPLNRRATIHVVF